MTKWYSATIAFLLVCAPTLFYAQSAISTSSVPLSILHVTPTGEDVPAGRQIVISFNRSVVPIGRMERKAEELPITLSPSLPCEWRWINTSALACNLPEQGSLAFATRYNIEIRPGIKAEDGTTIPESFKSSFTTARPAVSWKQFHLWRAPGHPVIQLIFNQSVSQESVEKHIFMQTLGADAQPNGAHIPLKVSADPDDRVLPDFLPLPGEPYIAFVQSTTQKPDADKRTVKGKEARRVWLVEPRDELPLDTHFVLKMEPGIVSALGPEVSAKEDVIVEFATFPVFAFLGVKCTTIDGRLLHILSEDGLKQQQAEANQPDIVQQNLLNKRKRHHIDDNAIPVAPQDALLPSNYCNPLAAMRFVFNAPVEELALGKALEFTPPIKGWKKIGSDVEDEGVQEVPPKDSELLKDYQHLSYLLKQPHIKRQPYDIWLPAGLKAAQSYHITSHSACEKTIAGNTEVQDMFSRKLAKPFDITFATDHRKPHFVFDHHDAVLEKAIDSEVPLFVDNIEKVLFNYRSVTSKDNKENQLLEHTIPAVKDIQFAVPFGVREALKGVSGVVYGTLGTDPETDAQPYERRIFAQVTPYQVHFKLGHFNSIAWVTDLATGNPVKGAKVTLYKDAFTTMALPKDILATANTNALGIAVFPGTEKLDPALDLTKYKVDEEIQFFLRVDKGSDMALLPVSHHFMINSYRSSGNDYIYPTNRELYGHMHAWGMTAQGIYRAGDTMQYKIYVRNQNNRHFILPPKQSYRLQILDAMGKKVYEENNINLSNFGSFSGEYTIPKEAAVGWYAFKLSADFGKSKDAKRFKDVELEEQQNRAIVSEGEQENQGEEAQESGDYGGKKQEHWVPMRVLVSDFTPASFKVTGQLNGDRFEEGQEITSTTHAELHSGGPYTKATARITALLQSVPFVSRHPLTKDFQFDSFENQIDSQQVFQKIDALDAKGELQQQFQIQSPGIVHGKLMVESAVQDDRGKYITGSSHADYIGVDRLVGLRATKWLYTANKPATIEYIVVDDRGTPLAGVEVNIAIEHQITKAARVKSAGNAYITNYHSEWEAAGECKGVSVSLAGACTFTPKEAGNYRATATIKDTKERLHTTKLYAYATGSDFVVWGDQSDTSLTIIPEKTDYKIGDKARYLIKNPYPGAKALITIERYGVLDQFVQTFADSTPVIEFPVKPDYLPGFYLSVTVISPRVDKPLEGQVDLGKPAFRMGYITVPVKDPYKEILVTAKSDKKIYKPRDKVTVTLHAKPRKEDTKEPLEIAVAVLDESVFDLIAKGKEAFDPYKGFYKLENLDLRNYSLLLKLVGRQKFEKKGANPGGDGGHDLGMRSLFKFVSYWNPSVKTDKNGNAKISFEAPDNLTGWRILTIATTPSDRFGLGEGNFKVNRPTEIRPVMPNQVTEGDSFNAGFSVMNRTDKARTINVTMSIEGNVEATQPLTTTVDLPPYQRTTVFMPVKTTAVALQRDIAEGAITFHAVAADEIDSDALTHHLSVHKQRSLEVAANYSTTTEPHAEESIQFPPNILPDVGSVSVVASPTVIGSVIGAFRYMYEYPYFCWEQQLTKAVMAAHYKELKSYLPEGFVWENSASLPQKTLDHAASFQAPNGGMTYYVAQDAYVDPYLSAYTALAFNWLRADGYKVPQDVEQKLQAYLQQLLRNNVMPDFYSEGMSASVRAVALAALAEQGNISSADIERYVPHVPKMSLFGKAHFLQAAIKTNANDMVITDVVQQLLASSNQTGGKFVFSETLDDGYMRILASPLRDNCAVLDSFTRYAATPKGKEQISDIPFKLVRMITQSRKSRDHWENTQENMFCMNALIDYARIYEKDVPDMKVTASMDNTSFGTAIFKSVRDEAATLERPIQKEDVGRKAIVNIEKSGTGRLYYATRLSYALPPEETHPANAGIEIHREYSVERNNTWELLKNPAEIKRGELVRVDLYVSVPAARNFVVVDDPIPGGLEPVNDQLATASKVDAAKGEYMASGGAWWFHYTDWIDYGISRWSFYHQELRDHAARFYSDYLPAGNYHLSYSAQAIATGRFTVMPAMGQEMYDPDVYGKTEALTLSIGEK